MFLGDFLAEDEVAWRARLPLLRARPVLLAGHAFLRGWRAFAEIVAAWHDAPAAALLAHLETQNWLLDYYQVHIDLVDLHLAALGADAAVTMRLYQRVVQHAATHHTPFFRRVAEPVLAV